MNKIALLKSLQHETHVMLKPSKIEGVGVFAIHRINKGLDPFGEEVQKYYKIRPEELVDVPQEVLRLIKKYYIFDKGCYELPSLGMSVMDIKCFVNHSNTPNCVWIENGESSMALMDIEEGEEITIDFKLLPDYDETKDNFVTHG